MNDANPSNLNFTWILPDGHTHIGYYINSTSNYLTVLPNHSDDFGQVICRAENELGLSGECHINMVMGGNYKLFSFFYKDNKLFFFVIFRYT